MVFLCSHYLLFFASEAVTPHHGTFNSILSLIVACWCQSCHLGCSVIVLQGVACLLHFSPWRVLRSSTEQRPQWLMLLTARNCAGYFSLESSHFFFFHSAKIYLSTIYVLGTGTTQWMRASVSWESAAYWEELAFNNEITQIGVWWWMGPSAVKGKKSCCRGLNQEPDLERAGVKLKLEGVTQREDFLGSWYNGCWVEWLRVLRT